MVTIYILKLVEGKYYVGKTTKSVETRFKQHLAGSSIWTTKYKPISIEETHYDCDVYDEDPYTIRTMAKYGIDNVRGGKYSNSILTDEQKKEIKASLDSANDLCFRCQGNHLARFCPNRKTTPSAPIDTAPKPTKVYKCSICGLSGHNKKSCKEIPKTTKVYKCSKCGLPGHNAKSCKKPTIVIKTADLIIPPFKPKETKSYKCSRCGKTGHNKLGCTEILIITPDLVPKSRKCSICKSEGHTKKACPGVNPTPSSSERKIHCSKCGREGHRKTHCSFKTNINGSKL